jgi:hypothetical protein
MGDLPDRIAGATVLSIRFDLYPTTVKPGRRHCIDLDHFQEPAQGALRNMSTMGRPSGRFASLGAQASLHGKDAGRSPSDLGQGAASALPLRWQAVPGGDHIHRNLCAIDAFAEIVVETWNAQTSQRNGS